MLHPKKAERHRGGPRTSVGRDSGSDTGTSDKEDADVHPKAPYVHDVHIIPTQPQSAARPEIVIHRPSAVPRSGGVIDTEG